MYIENASDGRKYVDQGGGKAGGGWGKGGGGGYEFLERSIAH